MDDLRVESYDASEAAAKKRSISKRVAVVGGAVVLTLGLFGLVGCVDDEERVEEQAYQVEEQTSQTEGRASWLERLRERLRTEPPEPPEPPPVVGGSGSWFVSVLESV